VDVAGLDPLHLYRYRFDLTLARPLSIPAQQRSILWRGAFGTVFRSLVCHDIRLECATCPLLQACPFPRTFQPSPPPDRKAIGRFRDPPRPFVFRDPAPEAAVLPAGEPLALGLTLVGRAVVDLPYFLVTFRKLGEEGIGRDRTRFTLNAAHMLDAAGVSTGLVYEKGSDLVRPLRHAIRARDLVRPEDTNAGRVQVRFVTPTDIRGDKDDGRDAPSFGSLVRRARDRTSGLATFFGDSMLDFDARAVGDSADRAVTHSSEITQAHAARRSTRTGQRHDVGGVLGSAVYEGDGIAAAMPWLRVAELINVGKHATFGSGRISVEVLG